MQAERGLDQRGQPAAAPVWPTSAASVTTARREPLRARSSRRRSDDLDVRLARRPGAAAACERLGGRVPGRRSAPGRDADAADHGVDPVAVADRVVEPLEHDGRRAVAPDQRPATPGASRPPRRRRGSPARSTAPTIASSSSPCRSRRTATSRARRPEVSSLETVKLGPPRRNSRAIRLAIRPPSAPIVRFAERAGRRRLASAAVQRSSSSSARPSPSASFHSRAWFEQRPAEVEVGRVQVEPDPDEDPRAEPRAVVPAGVGDRLGRRQERERLLREHLLQLPRRDPEPVEPAAPARRDSSREPLGRTRARYQPTPPTPHQCRGPRARPRSPAEDALLKRPQPPERPEVRRHARRSRSGSSSALGGEPVGRRADARPAVHSSIKTCALIPPNPNPLTAARRGRPPARRSQRSAAVRTRNGLAS